MASRSWNLLACALVAASLLLAPGSGSASDSGSTLQREAARLIERVNLLTTIDPTAPSALPSWIDAHPGSPLLVWGYGRKEPSYAIVPVSTSSGDEVGWIGMDVSTAEWQWYAEVDEATRSLVPACEALRLLRRRVADLPESDPGRMRLVATADHRLYWYLSWTDQTTARRELFIDPWDPARFLTERPAAPESLIPPGRLEEIRGWPPVKGDRIPPPRLRPDDDRPPSFYLEVPHYFQQTPYNCGPAALQMVFDYWGEEIDQSEIAGAANTTRSHGTQPSDLLRAGAFSCRSVPVVDTGVAGYMERGLGYAAIDADWSSPEEYVTRYEDLKDLIRAGYPILMLTWYDATYTVGHYRVLKGYDDRTDTFVVHDPWYSGPYMGPNVFFAQYFLVDILWVWPWLGRWGLLVAPWNVSVSAPDTVAIGEEFGVTAVVDYRAPHPFEGRGVASEPRADIVLPSGFELAAGFRTVQELRRIRLSGSADSAFWRVAVTEEGTDGFATMKVKASGLVSGISFSYPEYTDEIGGVGEATVAVIESSASSVFDFTLRSEPGRVEISWRMGAPVDPADLRLVARREGDEWEVPLAVGEPLDFSATDRARQLAAGGRVIYELCRRTEADTWTLLRSGEVEVESSIERTRLLGALPNPTGLPVAVSFLVREPQQQIWISVYDAAGRHVASLAGQAYGLGWHEVLWDGRDAAGRIVPAGVYLLRLDAGSVHESRTVVLLR